MFTNTPNIAVGTMGNPVLGSIRESQNIIIFEDLANIKLLNIPSQMVRQIKKPNASGDAFYVTGRKFKRIKTLE